MLGDWVNQKQLLMEQEDLNVPQSAREFESNWADLRSILTPA